MFYFSHKNVGAIYCHAVLSNLVLVKITIAYRSIYTTQLMYILTEYL